MPAAELLNAFLFFTLPSPKLAEQACLFPHPCIAINFHDGVDGMGIPSRKIAKSALPPLPLDC
jgi:hypothetical protein